MLSKVAARHHLPPSEFPLTPLKISQCHYILIQHWLPLLLILWSGLWLLPGSRKNRDKKRGFWSARTLTGQCFQLWAILAALQMGKIFYPWQIRRLFCLDVHQGRKASICYWGLETLELTRLLPWFSIRRNQCQLIPVRLRCKPFVFSAWYDWTLLQRNKLSIKQQKKANAINKNSNPSTNP